MSTLGTIAKLLLRETWIFAVDVATILTARDPIRPAATGALPPRGADPSARVIVVLAANITL